MCLINDDNTGILSIVTYSMIIHSTDFGYVMVAAVGFEPTPPKRTDFGYVKQCMENCLTTKWLQ